MVKINETELASVRLALAAAVAEKGEDYVYEKPRVLTYDDEVDEWFSMQADGCLYLQPVFDHDDAIADYAPSCIWGHALLTLGVDKDYLLNHNEDEAISSAGLMRPWSDPTITAAAAEVQRLQDMGIAWGHAVQAFEDYIEAARGVL